MLQETHSTEDTEQLWIKEWGGDIIFSHGDSNARGTCVLFDKSIAKTVHKLVTCSAGRSIIIDLEINGICFTLCNLYGPNEDDPEFYVKTVQEIESIPNDNRIVGGDFSLVLDLDLDKYGGKKCTNKNAQTVVNNWMEETELVDIWRFHHPQESKFTWHRVKPTKIFCRLDFFLVSYGLTEKIEHSSILPGFKSDHSLICIKFIVQENQRGKGFWKLNCSHLSDLEYVRDIKNVITTTAEINYEANANLLWDTIKMAVRGESIKFGARKKKEINNDIKELEGKIQNLESRLVNCSDDMDTVINELDQRKSELESIIKKKTEGAIIRSRAQWHEEGERNSKYFLNLEKRQANMKSINRLQTGPNKFVDSPNEILLEMKKFY